MDSFGSTPSGSFSVNSSTRFRSSLMGRSPRFSRVFKTVLPGLFDAHALQAGPPKSAQPLKYFDADILRRRDALAEFRDLLVQVLMIERLDHLTLDERIEVGKIGNHSRSRIDRPRDSHFHDVIVAVPVRIVAFAVHAPVL